MLSQCFQPTPTRCRTTLISSMLVSGAVPTMKCHAKGKLELPRNKIVCVEHLFQILSYSGDPHPLVSYDWPHLSDAKYNPLSLNQEYPKTRQQR
jgi:hypothetical protein